MTTLICSGTLFSNWQNIPKALVPTVPSKLAAHTDIAALAKEICQQQFQETDELDWTAFSPDEKYKDRANQLLSSVENEPLFIWDDNNSSLYLDFWKSTTEDAKFVLFYSSPELELSNYISSHPFDMSQVRKVTGAWVIRTRAMLTFFMNNRRRCLLVSVQTASSTNGSFINLLNKQYDLDLEIKPSTTPVEHKKSALIEYLATTILLKNQKVSELYDEVRSAATLISAQNKSIPGIENRNKSLINAFLTEVKAHKQLIEIQTELEDDLSLCHMQISQMQEELDHYFKKSIEQERKNPEQAKEINDQRNRIAEQDQKIIEQEKTINTIADYLNNDPLLKIVRHVRQAQ